MTGRGQEALIWMIFGHPLGRRRDCWFLGWKATVTAGSSTSTNCTVKVGDDDGGRLSTDIGLAARTVVPNKVGMSSLRRSEGIAIESSQMAD